MLWRYAATSTATTATALADELSTLGCATGRAGMVGFLECIATEMAGYVRSCVPHAGGKSRALLAIAS